MVVRYEEVLKKSVDCQHWLVSTLKQVSLPSALASFQLFPTLLVTVVAVVTFRSGSL